ncbi:apolipoprotein N-acyltransferase [Mangrovibacterium marinum]|uniref:Apolipoprotein N-acyltransferase n=1 Tax=Mangrovibacterium marinum TaxID=1639118 RepID=A0A2T5C5C6_9BACT|nr:apolipoprotein N-acyltransferase [Mangrovibacterium marinum]PTN10099.1 apolipoprotein N-acyltransferase [Mangrovibacterium marinum]
MNQQLKNLLLTGLAALLLSLPWLGIAPGWLLLGALVPLFILEDELERAHPFNPYLIFNYAFAAFWLWHLITVWWVLKVTLWGILFLSTANAGIMAAIWWFFSRMKKRHNRQLANIALIALWLSFEFLHHRWEIEWPWLCLGNGLAAQNKIIQWYELTGMAGGSLWILLSNILIFSGWKKLKARQYLLTMGYSLLLLLLIGLPLMWSLHRYANYAEEGKSIELAVLQPNIDPFTEKFSGMTAREQLTILLHLSDSVVSPQTQYVVAPETCLPELDEDNRLAENPFIRPFVGRAKQAPRLNFILGAMSRKQVNTSAALPAAARYDSVKKQWYELYNSALQVGSADTIAIYHKSILVAGVEKMPFQRYFRFLQSLSLDLGGTTGSLGIQQSPTVFEATHRVAPVICFESLFGQHLTAFVKKGAQFLAVITNDGWLPQPSGYRQHLHISRIRAIECRRSVVRSANTGISAIINQRGDVVQQTLWKQRTAFRGTIHLNDQLSFYVKYGDYIGRIALFTGSLLLLYFISGSIMRKQ